MDVGKSIGFVFEDRDWISKVLVGSAIVLVSFPLSIVLVGLLGFMFITGYNLEVLRNVREGRRRPLPEWRDRWGEWLVLGLKLWLVLFVWSLPGILLSIPSSLANWLIESGGSGGEVIGAMLVALFSCLSFLWWIILALVGPALYIRMAESEEIGSGFQFGEIYRFTRDHIADVFVAVIVSFIAGFALFLVGVIGGTILCVVGLVITLPAAVFLSGLIEAHLYAQVGLDRSRWTERDRELDVTPPSVPAVEETLPEMDQLTEAAEGVMDEFKEGPDAG